MLQSRATSRNQPAYIYRDLHVVISLCLYSILQGPVINVDTPSLEFGLIQVEEKCCMPLTLTNNSKSFGAYQLRQLVTRRNEDRVDEGRGIGNVMVSSI